MTPCSSLQHIFSPPMPENPTLLESLDSWNQIKNIKPDNSGYTEIFGELHFSEKPISDLKTVSELEKLLGDREENGQNVLTDLNKKNGLKKEILHNCTEGLGFESSDEVDETKRESREGYNCKDEMGFTKESMEDMKINGGFKRWRKGYGFPPPISSIGRGGTPWVCLKPFRHDGRFILRTVRIRTQEFLQASREDGRLKLQLVQRDEEKVHGENDIKVVEYELKETRGEEEGDRKEIREEEIKVAEEEGELEEIREEEIKAAEEEEEHKEKGEIK